MSNRGTSRTLIEVILPQFAKDILASVMEQLLIVCTVGEAKSREHFWHDTKMSMQRIRGADRSRAV